MVKKFMLAGALLLTVLHNVVPHAHHGELAAQEHDRLHRQADDLFDWLGLVFQQDLGFSPVKATYAFDSEQSVTPSPALAPDGSPHFDPFPIGTPHHDIRGPVAPPARQAITAHGLRGPPPAA